MVWREPALKRSYLFHHDLDGIASTTYHQYGTDTTYHKAPHPLPLLIQLPYLQQLYHFNEYNATLRTIVIRL